MSQQKLYIVDSMPSEPEAEQLSLELTLTDGKKRANKYQQNYGVYELISVIKYPVPDLEVVPVTG